MSDPVQVFGRGLRSGPQVRKTVVLGAPADRATVAAAVPTALLERAADEPQRAFPAIAKEPDACGAIVSAVGGLPSVHRLHLGDSRNMEIEPQSVELVVTSPPTGL